MPFHQGLPDRLPDECSRAPEKTRISSDLWLMRISCELSEQQRCFWFGFQGAIEIVRDTRDHRVEMVGEEEVIGAGNDIDLDLHTFLDRQPLDQLVNRFRRHGGVFLAVNRSALTPGRAQGTRNHGLPLAA